ncbi:MULTISPECIES: diacylglycerol/polyprenol kinase family protein [Leptospira]|uniref:Putative phosphatidate cytidylyltransferase n=3 Tax=Leptospira weilii TaxID=28184 RepID=A0A828YY49_9LEPT|nr:MULTISPECIES: dolichol kinase [Leptospira]EMM71036.1 putative phosphatidate cytidylyltransferase [Leptospira weilii str. 2006001855]EKR62835.1 putative phosphatidate cytidylyltransferase [Leptospira weilii str. 2006001853]EMJ64450.1 putative phosphatidate cytidylyltransferase [Leptospira sp. P2653]EMN91215.1 putative phosphatidate cytidylyltransferase [Leptospira weilii str. UI 13098]MCL8267807.1 dolichol kinase [Leptospira weilii]
MANLVRFNYARKLWHLLGLIFPVCYYLDVFQGAFGLLNATRAVVFVSLVFCLGTIVLLEYFRFRFPGFQRFFLSILGALMKEEEKTRLNGTLPYFLSCAFVVLLFPPEISILAMLFLVIGDPTAAWIGTFYGKHRFSNGKSVEGIVAFVVVCSIVGFVFMYLSETSDKRNFLRTEDFVFYNSLIFLIPAILISAVTELYCGTYWNGLVDDNLLIPSVSAIVLGFTAWLILGVEPSAIFLNVTELFLRI